MDAKQSETDAKQSETDAVNLEVALNAVKKDLQHLGALKERQYELRKSSAVVAAVAAGLAEKGASEVPKFVAAFIARLDEIGASSSSGTGQEQDIKEIARKAMREDERRNAILSDMEEKYAQLMLKQEYFSNLLSARLYENSISPLGKAWHSAHTARARRIGQMMKGTGIDIHEPAASNAQSSTSQMGGQQIGESVDDDKQEEVNDQGQIDGEQSRAESKVQEWDFTCAQCKKGGKLLCCALCPQVVCSVCFGGPFPPADAKWHCGLLGNGARCSTRRVALGSNTHAIIPNARAAFQQSLVPDDLLCRHNEIKMIIKIAKSQFSSSVLIVGPTGTGKTAVAQRVKQVLMNETDIKCVYVNGWAYLKRQGRFDKIYADIAWRVLDQVYSATEACKVLSSHFGAGGEERNARPGAAASQTLLIVDEFDKLQSQVMYNLLEWARANKMHKLTVVGITTNDAVLDTPSRITSRIKHTLRFHAYTKDQIIEILKDRGQSFNDDAIDLCALKVSTTTGDIRVAFEICKRATDICIENGRRNVTFGHVSEAIRGMFQPLIDRFLPHTTLPQKIFIKALILESKQREPPVVEYDKVVRRYQSLSRLRGHAFLTEPTELRNLCQQLENANIVSVSNGKIPRNPNVHLNTPVEDINRILRSDRLWSRMMNCR